MDNFKNYFGDFDSFFNDFDAFFNQPFNSMGETKTEKGEDSKGEWIKQTFTSKDGSVKMTSFVRGFSIPGKKSNKTSAKIGDLKAELEACVEKQDFEKACELRDLIKSIEDNKSKIEALNKELDKLVKEQNFEKAIEVRDKIKKLQK